MTYSIENDYLKVTADTLGAQLTSVINKRTGEEMMWDANPDVWPSHGPVLFPICGKLKNGKTIIDGKEYEIPKHGFIKDMEHEFVSAENNQLKFVVHSNEETMKMLPRHFDFETIFTINDNTLTHTIKVTNKSNKELRFSLGFHPAFALPFDKNHSTKDYELQFEIPQTPIVKDNFMTGPNEGLVSGKTHPIAENSKTIKLDDRMFDSDSICLSQMTAKTISLVEKDTDKKITLNIEDFPYVLLWSQLGTETLKFLCIEPWLAVQDTAEATGNWNEKPSAAELQPGEIWQKDLKITYNR